MRRLAWFLVLAVTLGALCVVGCKKGPGAGQGPASPVRESAKTAD